MQASDSLAPQLHTPPEQRVPYMPGLDGLRALAVLAVLLYHAEIGLAGGYLGVETFFVLSGYLITALLLAEWRQAGRIDLLAFWLRRARRLLPALLLMLLGSALLAGLLLPGESSVLAGDLLAALGYVSNWRLVLTEQPYFDPMVRPPLLQHLWSLAVEEQFYLAWPLLFGLGMRRLGRRGLLAGALLAALASLGLMAWLHQPGADPARIYYGTDTRASALLLGVALALARPAHRAVSFSSAPARALDAAGLLGLLGLLCAYAWFYSAHPLLYRGGFALVAALSALVIAAAAHPGARATARLLGARPLRWVGQRSYGIYLWHWPIFTVTLPYQDVPFGGWALLALRLAIVFALAELSHRLVEAPIRAGALSRLWRARGRLRRPVRARAARWRAPSVPIMGMVLVFSATCSVPIGERSSPPPIATTATVAGPPRPADAPTSTPAGAVLAAPTATAPAAPTAGPAAPTPALPTPAATAAPAERPIDPALAAELQQILDQLVADGSIPGAVLAVHIAGQQPWSGASGIRDRDTRAPITPDTRMRIASISKIFTAVVLLQLAEEGRLELDAPISSWLPGLVPNGEQISVRHLLQHTSGLYDYLEDRSMVNKAYRDPQRLWQPAELVGYASTFAPAFKPGARGAWDYSSTNYVLLGMIAEAVTGRTLAQEMRARIFEPLALTSTFFAPDEPVLGAQARGYSNRTDQTAVAMSFAYATANIVSTADDVRRFAEALFGGELLEPATQAQMLTFVSGKGQYKMPALEYGLGVMRNQLAVGPGPAGAARPAEAATVLGHIGGFGGFRSAVWHAPERGITIALGLNQAATDPNILATRAFETILASQGR